MEENIQWSSTVYQRLVVICVIPNQQISSREVGKMLVTKVLQKPMQATDDISLSREKAP